MPSDPTKPLLRLTPRADQPRPIGRARPVPSPDTFPRDRQTGAFGPKFTRLAEILSRGNGALELRADPAALAPERLLVFEVRGTINSFAASIRQVGGLELVDEEELDGDEQDKQPVAYLLVPDMVALRNLESLWRRWQSGQLVRGETPWANVFEHLRDLRVWGPDDRVQQSDRSFLSSILDGHQDNDLIRLEIELVFRANEAAARLSEEETTQALTARGGQVLSRSRLPDISYHALLADIPAWAVREIIERRIEGIAGLDTVMHIRPQSEATTVEISDPEDSPQAEAQIEELGEPILAVLDGVPVSGHKRLAAHIDLDDPFDLEPDALVASRAHGTAMASLVIHGDLNRGEVPLPRKIHMIPVLGNNDAFPPDRLIVDMIYLAVTRLRQQRPGIVIVNLSLGNQYRPFHNHLSPWARLLDRLAYRFGLLFVVSAGNQVSPFGMPTYATSRDYEDADAESRAKSMVETLHGVMADRRMLSPAETVNGITVGAGNVDAVGPAERGLARSLIDPFPAHVAANPSSSLGPGFARSVKPDILMPGSREHMTCVGNHRHIDIRPAQASRGAGLKVAAPPRAGRENLDGYSNGTSAAAALASRTCHRIHDALESAYGDAFLRLPPIQRAVLLKALLVHPAQWPRDTAELIKRTLGPVGRGQASKQKDNIRRFLGYGYVDADDAVACAADRATFFATGLLGANRIASIDVPVPVAIGGKARPHNLSATVAWFSPVLPGRKSYRSCRLKILTPAEIEALSVSGDSWHPDENQSNRGTVSSRRWYGTNAPVVVPNMTIPLVVQRDPDQGAPVDEEIPFGLAVTISMPGEIEIYDEVRARIAPQVQARSADGI
ncbi:S8 family serine peptidase [Paracoccus sp. YIM 132242]|uniref:S8 family serine peptidase n=1 Tax=Paracoccus lichenicola TaxID=2665644 RepID=A0A6L6HV08_9RHOB|nr:S8 family serine peptidase [Paracoccus lichenicola]